MDELSSVVLLNKQDSASIVNFFSGKKEKSVSTSDPSVHVLVTAGQGGLLRLYRVELNGKDTSSFSCVSLSQMGPYDDLIEKTTDNYELNAITNMHYFFVQWLQRIPHFVNDSLHRDNNEEVYEHILVQASLNIL